MRFLEYLSESNPIEIKISQLIKSKDFTVKKVSNKLPHEMTEKEWKETVHEFYRLKKLSDATFGSNFKWRLDQAGMTSKQVTDIRRGYADLKNKMISYFDVKDSKYKKDSAVKFTDSAQKIERMLTSLYDKHSKVVKFGNQKRK